MIPGGAPFSQLNKGVKDAMVESTGLVVRQFMIKTCKKAMNPNNNNLHNTSKKIMLPFSTITVGGEIAEDNGGNLVSATQASGACGTIVKFGSCCNRDSADYQ